MRKQGSDPAALHCRDHSGRIGAAGVQGKAISRPCKELPSPIPRQGSGSGNHGFICNELAYRPFSRSEEHTSELQSLMRISYAVFCLKKKNKNKTRKS